MEVLEQPITGNQDDSLPFKSPAPILWKTFILDYWVMNKHAVSTQKFTSKTRTNSMPNDTITVESSTTVKNYQT